MNDVEPHTIQSTTARPSRDKARRELARIKDDVGLIALGFFGIALIASGFAVLFRDRLDGVDIAAGLAIATPGLAALLMAGYGLWRMPAPVRVED
jgi:hypothetical protein